MWQSMMKYHKYKLNGNKKMHKVTTKRIYRISFFSFCIKKCNNETIKLSISNIVSLKNIILNN